MKRTIFCVFGLVLAAQSCRISLENKPVCGSDGRTYFNERALECETAQRGDLQKVSDEKCEECKCLPLWAPVCGTDGVSYFSPCQMVCLNNDTVQLKSGGMCPCGCEPDYSPVCGCDGRTYGNKCIFDCYATALEITMVSEGEC